MAGNNTAVNPPTIEIVTRSSGNVKPLNLFISYSSQAELTILAHGSTGWPRFVAESSHPFTQQAGEECCAPLGKK